ncbi:hypothetical protein [Ralstonia pseudosolanacearum]|uniref:hypothetical protein n=1 Tax=Ralstonia pseudosolanacearum TaxID=1310165 RepID=UPI00399D5DF5
MDAAKLLACADRDATDYVLPLVQHWHAGKRNGIRDLLDPAQPIESASMFLKLSLRIAVSFVVMDYGNRPRGSVESSVKPC